jgi:hypothetical protein
MRPAKPFVSGKLATSSSGGIWSCCSRDMSRERVDVSRERALKGGDVPRRTPLVTLLKRNKNAPQIHTGWNECCFLGTWVEGMIRNSDVVGSTTGKFEVGNREIFDTCGIVCLWHFVIWKGVRCIYKTEMGGRAALSNISCVQYEAIGCKGGERSKPSPYINIIHIVAPLRTYLRLLNLHPV